jgi:hypothetical protein
VAACNFVEIYLKNVTLTALVALHRPGNLGQILTGIMCVLRHCKIISPVPAPTWFEPKIAVNRVFWPSRAIHADRMGAVWQCQVQANAGAVVQCHIVVWLISRRTVFPRKELDDLSGGSERDEREGQGGPGYHANNDHVL